MPNVSEMNQELVRAFNISLCYNSIAITNLTVQNLHDKDHIVISFDKNTKLEHRVKYLNALKDKIIRRSHKDKEAASVSYNSESFPFKFNKGQLEKDNKGKRFLVEIDKDVIFNLKCYLAKAFVGDVTERMGKKYGSEYLREHIYNVSFDKNSYLYCMRFYDKRLKEDFVNLLSAQVRRYEENAPSDYLKVDGDHVYIKKGIFDNIEFIKDIEAHNASLICRDFQTPSNKSKVVENLKFPIVDFIRRMGIPVHSMIRTSYKGNNEDSILVPIVEWVPIDHQDAGRYLSSKEVHKINNEFGMEVLSDVSESISTELPRSSNFDGAIYGTDFSDLDISYCVMNKVIENSVINKNHALSIDPELRFRALSPLVSPAHESKPGPNGGSPEKEQKATQRTLWSRLSGGSNKSSKETTPAHKSKPGPSGGSQENPGAFDREGSGRSNSSTDSGGKRKRAVMSGDWSDQGLIIDEDAFVRGASERKSGESGYHTNGTTSKAGSESPEHKPLSQMGSLTAKQHSPDKKAVEVH